jgi:hypothetical protein
VLATCSVRLGIIDETPSSDGKACIAGRHEAQIPIVIASLVRRVRSVMLRAGRRVAELVRAYAHQFLWMRAQARATGRKSSFLRIFTWFAVTNVV